MPHIPDDVRAAVIADLKRGGTSTRQLAKDHGIARGSVHNIAKDAGLLSAFDRSQTENATAARAADCRARREKLKADLLDDAERLRDRAWSPYELVMETRNTGIEHITLELPPLPDVRAAYAALSIAIEKSVKLEQYDAVSSDGDAKSMLGALAEGIRRYAEGPSDQDRESDD